MATVRNILQTKGIPLAIVALLSLSMLTACIQRRWHVMGQSSRKRILEQYEFEDRYLDHGD